MSELALVPPTKHEWRLVIPGESVAKDRARSTIIQPKGKPAFVSHYTPARTRRYEDIVRQRATQAWNAPVLRDSAITLFVRCFRVVPASWSKKRAAMAIAGEIEPTGKPDLDNLVKSITDGLNGVIWYDDSMIVSCLASKAYAVEPRVELFITWRLQP